MQHCWLGSGDSDFTFMVMHQQTSRAWTVKCVPSSCPTNTNSNTKFLVFFKKNFRERLPGDGEASIDDFDDEDDGIDDLYEDADGADEGMTVNVRYFEHFVTYIYFL